MGVGLRMGRRAVCVLAASAVGVGGAIVAVAATPAAAATTCGGLAVTVQGTAASQTLTGTTGNDVIDSGGGNDVINGLAGNDTICAGTGNDTIDGGAGTDTVSFEKTAAVVANLTTGVASGPGSDTLANVENLTGSPGSDTLTGNVSVNSIVGALGNDTMNGAGGVDTVVFAGAVAVNANLTTGTATGLGSDTLANFENVNGSSGNDTLTGNAGANTILGGLGNDTMNGAGGVDTASFLGFAAVNANLTTGVATGSGNDTLTGFENLSGSLGNDTLTGDAANNTIDGWLGNDTMNGAGAVDTAAFSGTVAVNANLTTGTATGLGNDTLTNFENLSGSSGNDVLTGSATANSIDGGLGNDTMNGAGGVDTATFAGFAAVNANLTTGTATGLGSDTLANFENLTGSYASDTLTGNATNNTLNGSASTDTCAGAAGSDHAIDCEIGNSSINSGGQTDTYSFTFAANQKLYLDSTSYAPTVGNLVWTLTGPGGTLFGPQFADSDVDTFTILSAGAHTLTVNGSGVSDTGTQSFRLYTVVDQTGPLTLGTPKSTTFTVPGQTARYTFTGALNQRITLSLSGSTIDNGVVYFVQPDGGILTGYGFDTSDLFIEPVVLNAAGTWTILIDPYSSKTGSVTVVANAVVDQTGTITLGVAKAVTISQAGQNAKYTFSGALNQRISLNLSGSTIAGGTIWLVRPDGSTLTGYSFNAGDQFIDPSVLDVAGTWAVLIDPTGASTGSVTVLASAVVDQTGTITLGTPKTATITQVGQNARFTFIGALNQRISVNLSGSTIQGGVVYFVRPDGGLFTGYGFDTSDQFIDPVVLDVAGTWTLMIDPSATNTGSVTVLAAAVVDQTGTIALGTPKTVTINQAGQNAKYTFTGALNQRISVNLSSSTMASGVVYLVRPDGSLVAGYGFGPGATFVDPSVLDVAGTWSVLIDPQGASTGSVTVLARAVVDQTGTITLGVAKAVTISQPGQRARYTFHGNNGQAIAINITSSTFTSGLLYFYRPDGIQYTGIGFGTGTTNIGVNLDATGTWTVEVDPSGAYTGSANVKLT